VLVHAFEKYGNVPVDYLLRLEAGVALSPDSVKARSYARTGREACPTFRPE